MKLMSELKIGGEGKIESISPSASLKLKRRLLELGFTQGQNVKLVRRSLLSHAFLVEIRGYVLSVKREIAALVIVG